MFPIFRKCSIVTELACNLKQRRVELEFSIDMGKLASCLWERHKNIWSWFMRPLFGIIMFYGAWQNSWLILLLGLLGLSTSWCWFPRPKSVHPWVEKFINVEKRYITPPWTLPKVGSLIGVLAFVIVGLTMFWFQNLKPALLLMFLGGLAKSFWSVKVSGRAGIFAACFGIVWSALSLYLYLKLH